jgi:hypothetical protein
MVVTIRRLVAFSVVFVLSFSSCRKADVSQPQPNELGEKSDYVFLRNSLRSMAIDFKAVVLNPELRGVVRDFASRKFDQEPEVLLQDLMSNSVVRSNVNGPRFKDAQDELWRRAGSRWYPQIYIPSIEEKGGDQLLARAFQEEEPTLVFYTGDMEVDSSSDGQTFPGYKISGDSLIFFAMVDEQYADNHNVWIYSLNEVVNQNGKFVAPCDAGGVCPPVEEGDGGGSGPGGSGGSEDDDPTDAPARKKLFPELGHAKKSFQITDMAVKEHKERWLSGGSEVSIRAKLVCHNGRDQGDIIGAQKEYTSDQYSNLLGKLVRKFSRREVKNATVKTINYNMQRDWQVEYPAVDPVYFVYVIFERDAWPAGVVQKERFAPISPFTGQDAPGPFNLWYRTQGANSGETPYAEYLFCGSPLIATAGTYAGAGSVSNQSIIFATSFY